ncbi:GMC family oxidoreductase N-terminal domain-containing protein [Rhodoferax sp. 4810]|nr:GMC family oxidoreductase N-terminal domain-containing protein [Rhodoferax jenense]
MEEFDYIVVGAGPGGCVVSSRLTEDPAVSVALLESGPDRRGLLNVNLALGSATLVPRKTASNYAFDTVVDKGLNNRRAFHPIGRGLGGGTAINNAMYIRGHSGDYDEWAALGNPGWSYADVLPYFKRAENNQTYRNEFHGNAGPVWVEDLRTDNPYHAIVKQACAEAGLPYCPDFNGAEQEGYNTTQVTMKNGERNNAGKAYILPHLGVRQNLRLFVDTTCTRILFENKRAVGVEVISNGECRQIRARREVIVSSGGLLSAKLLQLSGVGNGQDLQALGIPVVHDRRAVGENLQDHIDVVLGYHIPGDPNLLGISPTAAGAVLTAVRRYKNERRGMGATNFAEVTGFMKLTPESARSEIQYEFVIALAMDHGRKVLPQHGMSAHVLLLRPKSSGTVKLASGNFEDDPLIDFRYYNHPNDLTTMVEGVKRTAAIFNTPTFKRLVKRDLVTAHCKTDDDWAEFCRNVGGTNYHPVGSCRMGLGDDSVVDARLRVHGMQGLRIVDSSIFPKIMGGNTMTPSIMVGEKGADMIKEDWK